MTEIDFAKRVACGVRLLDAKRPGWRGEINLSVFDIADSRYCVVGQLFGDWDVGTHKLGMHFDKHQQVLHGFELYDDEYLSFSAGPLSVEWIKAIRDGEK